MRILPLFLVFAMVGCDDSRSPRNLHARDLEQAQVVEDDAPFDTGTCADEGEPCEDYGKGGSNCCNNRHTCYSDGCYY